MHVLGVGWGREWAILGARRGQGWERECGHDSPLLAVYTQAVAAATCVAQGVPVVIWYAEMEGFVSALQHLNTGFVRVVNAGQRLIEGMAAYVASPPQPSLVCRDCSLAMAAKQAPDWHPGICSSGKGFLSKVRRYSTFWYQQR